MQFAYLDLGVHYFVLVPLDVRRMPLGWFWRSSDLAKLMLV